MPARTMDTLMRNDLKVVTIFMVLVFILTAALEVRPQDIGHIQPPSPVTPEPGSNQTENLTTSEILSRSAYTSEGQSTPVTFAMGFKKVTMVKARLTWSDDYGSNDEFKLEISLDGESLGAEQGSTGEIAVQAEAQTGQNLAGNFTVTITCVSAPGMVGPSPIDRDKGNSWDLLVSATHSEEGGP